MRKRIGSFLVYLALTIAYSSFSFSHSHNLSRSSLSGIDAKYKLDRVKKLSHKAINVKSSGVGFYRKILKQTLSSSCNFYPSDSLKAQLDFKRCSPSYSILSAMERFYKEPDAANLGFDIVQIKNKNYFFDLTYDCEFWR